MPMTKIYLREGSAPEHKHAISEAIHRALVEVLGIPEDDRFHVFHELSDENLISAPVAFGLPRRREAVALQLYFGPRPVEVLNRLFEALVSGLTSTAGLERRDIYLNVIESPSPNWWAQGRVLDPETGFDVRIASDHVPEAS
ncbi:tautomerase family protein [Amycolatopsis jiangsuensis]|uniref:Phenylpyruvate tautomerase PptA (4-oxalocrotonate tautomerase family) n=1 Tax=Amycolatopsis jiangsuensis TaxID=1181879 RepID=A0A840IQ78_9PSEU|nr:tautomerase family protein [Amycolatopsis jiangsuensis]MBB4683352.1 phenylpyruvate tautomerase PptA (4-oxalocrotonate tautomerase family) [Amycolatopsis jiangsuensis]